MYNENRSSQIPALPINKAQKRLYAASSDPTFEHDTYQAMQTYVDTDPTAYLGQILYCKANDTMYRISNDNGRKVLTETGIKGPKGDKGEMGPQGPKGEIPNMTEYDNRLDKIDEQLEDSLIFDLVMEDNPYVPSIGTELAEQIEDINEQLEERVEFEAIEGNDINLPPMSTSELIEEVYQINKQLGIKANKIETQNIQTQVNNLVLGAVGNGNNAEIEQARGDYPVLNARLDDIDIYKFLGRYNLFDFTKVTNEKFNVSGYVIADDNYRLSEHINIGGLNKVYIQYTSTARYSVFCIFYNVNKDIIEINQFPS